MKERGGLYSGENSRYQIMRSLYAVSGSLNLFRQNKKPLKSLVDGKCKIAFGFYVSLPGYDVGEGD